MHQQVYQIHGYTGRGGYKPGDLLKQTSREDIVKSFESSGYNWHTYAGNNFHGMFVDSMDIHATLNHKKTRKQIGPGENDEYISLMNKAGQATAGNGWRGNYANAALTVANVIERGSGQWVKYGFSNNGSFSPATKWDCSRSGEFLTNFSVNAELQKENASKYLGDNDVFRATTKQDAYGLKLNPYQLASNYEQITDPSKIKSGDTLYAKVPGENGKYTQHTLNVVGTNEGQREIYTYDTKWGLDIVRYDQITTKSVKEYDSQFTPKDNSIGHMKFVATDMTEYAKEQETISRWCAEEAEKTGKSVETMWDAVTKAMKNTLDTEKGSSISECRKVIHAMGDENQTVEVHGKGVGERGNTHFTLD